MIEIIWQDLMLIFMAAAFGSMVAYLASDCRDDYVEAAGVRAAWSELRGTYRWAVLRYICAWPTRIYMRTFPLVLLAMLGLLAIGIVRVARAARAVRSVERLAV